MCMFYSTLHHVLQPRGQNHSDPVGWLLWGWDVFHKELIPLRRIRFIRQILYSDNYARRKNEKLCVVEMLCTCVCAICNGDILPEGRSCVHITSLPATPLPRSTSSWRVHLIHLTKEGSSTLSSVSRPPTPSCPPGCVCWPRGEGPWGLTPTYTPMGRCA